MYEYPFGNGQQLNLDWFLAEWKNLLAAWEAEKNGIDGALQAEIDRAEAALADIFAARDAAAQSAANALESKNAAAQSASDASGYLATVRADANTASNAAQNAAQSESNAADSAQTAVTSKNAAGQSERNAAQSEANANSSKNDAAQSAADALANKDAAAQSAADADASKSAAAQSAINAANSADTAAQSAASIEFTDISNQIVLDTTNFTILGKSILKLKDMIFFSIRAKANITDRVLTIWSYMPISGNTGPVGSSPWMRCPAQAIEYASNIAEPNIAACVIADRKLFIKGPIENHYYEVCGFFKTNFTT